MKIIDLNQQEFNGECVVGLGNFDGFHLRHQSLFSNVKTQGKRHFFNTNL